MKLLCLLRHNFRYFTYQDDEYRVCSRCGRVEQHEENFAEGYISWDHVKNPTAALVSKYRSEVPKKTSNETNQVRFNRVDEELSQRVFTHLTTSGYDIFSISDLSMLDLVSDCTSEWKTRYALVDVLLDKIRLRGYKVETSDFDGTTIYRIKV